MKKEKEWKWLPYIILGLPEIWFSASSGRSRTNPEGHHAIAMHFNTSPGHSLWRCRGGSQRQQGIPWLMCRSPTMQSTWQSSPQNSHIFHLVEEEGQFQENIRTKLEIKGKIILSWNCDTTEISPFNQRANYISLIWQRGKEQDWPFSSAVR